MKIEVWSIGKKDDAIFKDAIAEYSKRINRYHNFEIKAIASKASANADINNTLYTECAQIQALICPTDLLIVLDDKGKQKDTQAQAKEFEKWLTLGKKRIVLLIGGAYGIDSNLKQQAHYIWSLSSLTMPHQLVRLVLSEQIYRICTVLNGEQYHHE